MATGSATLTASPSRTAGPGPQGGGELRILACLPYPQPNPQALKFLLAGPAQALEIRIYTPAMALAATAEAGPRGTGWQELGLPTGLANGVFYYRLSARGGGASASASGKLLWLR